MELAAVLFARDAQHPPSTPGGWAPAGRPLYAAAGDAGLIRIAGDGAGGSQSISTQLMDLSERLH